MGSFDRLRMTVLPFRRNVRKGATDGGILRRRKGVAFSAQDDVVLLVVIMRIVEC